MSLTTDIATMIARYEALAATYDNKVASINAAVAAALAAIPALSMKYYVDAVNGSDAKDGLTAANALQTIGKALSLGGPGRAIEIRLLADYVMTSILGIPQNSSVHIIADGYSADTAPNVRRRMTFTMLPNASTVTTGDWQLASFRQSNVGYCSFDMTAIEIVLPSAPEGTLTPDYYNGVISSNALTASSLMAVQLRTCLITAPASPAGWILGLHPTRAAVLSVASVTFDASKMPGRWISGFAAGAQVSASTRIMSNLVTL